MSRGFPPQPVYPVGIDSDYTLFLVSNTTETVLPVDNQAWEEEVAIVPVGLGELEIWAGNGFATIEGELLYYDAVGTTDDGRVNLLKRCARNLGGTRTQFNPAGTWIRSFVIAEHHNQIVDALLNVEDFVGINFDERVPTLDYRIRHLRDTPVIWDDFSCPDVTLNFVVVDDSPVTGILAEFDVQVAGNFNTFSLSFGDGQSTGETRGTHRYAQNSTIDPVVTVSNDQCQIIQTQIQRTSPEEPRTTPPPGPLIIPIPDFPPPPPFIIPSLVIPRPEPSPAPIVFPCIDFTPFPGINISIGPIDIQVPSVITFTPINIPSTITFSPLNIPSLISISPINIPTLINFGPTPVIAPIGFGPTPVIAPIGFGPTPVISPINIDVTVTIDGGSVPSCISMCSSPVLLGVDWGSPPTLNVAFAHQVSAQGRKHTPEDLALMRELGDDYREFFPEADNAFSVEYSSIGIPTEITILPPTFKDIHVTHDLPRQIEIVAGDYDLSGKIEIIPPKTPIPQQIEIVNRSLPSMIEITGVPSVIRIEHDLPDRIVVETLTPIPATIRLDVADFPDQIKVVGFPESIQLIGPSEILLAIPDDLEVPLVYRGAPIEVKIDVPKAWMGGDDEDDGRMCYMLQPCPRGS